MTLIIVCARTGNIPEYRKQLLEKLLAEREVRPSLTLRSNAFEPEFP